MAVFVQQTQDSSEPIDSSGTIYKQFTKNSPLTDYFLQHKYINYKQVQLDTISNRSVKLISDNSISGRNLSFHYSDFVLLIMLIMFALLTYIKLAGRNYFNRLFMSLVNYSYSLSFYKEKNLGFVLYNNIMLFIFYLSSGFLITSLLEFFQFPKFHPNDFMNVLEAIGISFFLISLNRIVVRIAGLILGSYRTAAEYLFYYGNLIKIGGIILFGLCIGLYFISNDLHSIFIYASILVASLIYFVKVYRALIIFFNNRFSLYYLILYFCALEIIPVVLLIKLFQQYFATGHILVI